MVKDWKLPFSLLGRVNVLSIPLVSSDMRSNLPSEYVQYLVCACVTASHTIRNLQLATFTGFVKITALLL